MIDDTDDDSNTAVADKVEPTTAAQYATAAAFADSPASPMHQECPRSLRLMAQVRSAGDLKACARIVGSYNFFESDNIVTGVDEAFSDFNIGTIETTSAPMVRAMFGRESSPVLYLALYEHAFGDTVSVADSFRDAVESFAEITRADEFDNIDPKISPVLGDVCYRLWWD